MEVLMPERQYTIIPDPDEEEGCYSVTVPALAGCITQGETLEEAIAMAKGTIRGYLEALSKADRPDT
jgi:antitoxin HicB